jgi:membrane associated rhomboid family serine protease
LRCSRCDRPICGRCAIPASVGQHCPECVAAARKSTPKVRTVLAATAPATRAILILTAIVFVGQLFSPQVLDRLAMYPPFIANGEWWRLLTPMLVHAGALHFMMNAYVFLMIGPAVEQRYGPARFTFIYVVAGFTGAVASFALSGERVVGVGASGAILGVLGAFMADLYQRRGTGNVEMQIKGMWRWLAYIFGIGLAFQILGQLGVGILSIDNYAHAGGLIGGAAVGWALGTERKAITARGVAISVGVILVFAGIAAARIAVLKG